MYPLPALEEERLLALRACHILDSGPAPDFDAVVALVRDVFDVPTCAVVLIDADRQWFKARCGIDLDGTDRTLAFCNHTLLSDEPVIVEDATVDTRFSDHPWVTGDPHIRFYAGAPLLLSSGIALGSLCVVGDRAREVTDAEILVLKRAAAIATGLIRGHGTAQDAARLARDTAVQSAIIGEQARDLRIRERRFRQTETIAKVGGWEFDLDTEAVAWSDEVYRIYDVPVGTPVDFALAASAYPEVEWVRLQALIQRAVLDGTPCDAEFEFKTASGHRKWVRTTGEVEVHNGRPKRLFGIFQDVSDRHQAEERLWRIANRDALTGLANRNRFDGLLDTAFGAPDRDIGLLMIDADHLKEVNDTRGHDAGDELIRTLAHRLNETVDSAGTVARVGGDEFAVLIPAPVAADTLETMAQAILEAMRPSFVFNDITLKPGVSIGGSLGLAGGTSEVIRQSADLALYHAKAHRRGGFALFHDGMRSAVTARIAAINAVDDALAAGEVCAWYQPIVDLATGRVSCLEALARVRQGDAMISIGAFADALQDRRTATRLTACILERIEADAAGWREAGITPPRIAFNVGPLDFQEGAIESRLLSICERTGFAPSQFAMEVTESVFLSRDAGLVAETAARLRARGVAVALDDFGTGHASLAHLGTFPVDIIKMDRSFVTRMNDSGRGAVIAAALIDLAHKLGVQVVAEGVEHEVQLDHLLTLGCENAQGYLFSQALPPTALAGFLAAFQPPLSIQSAAGIAGSSSWTRDWARSPSQNTNRDGGGPGGT